MIGALTVEGACAADPTSERPLGAADVRVGSAASCWAMRRAVPLVISGAVLVAGTVALSGRDGTTGPTASSCRDTAVAFNAGSDTEPSLLVYEDHSSRHLTPEDWNSTEPSFSPDGSEIALIRTDTGWGDGGPLATELWVVPTSDGSDGRAVVDEPGRRTDPAWSPIADTIAFVEWSQTGDDRTLRLVDADGTNNRALVEVENAYLHSPAWSPDGTRIAFIEQRLTAASTGYVYEVRLVDPTDEGQAETVAEIPGASNLSWSSNGNEILVSTYEGEDGTLLLLNPSDGTSTTIAEDATMGVLADDSTVFFLDRVEQGSWQFAVGTLDGEHLGDRTRLGDDRIYAYGFFALDSAPCNS